MYVCIYIFLYVYWYVYVGATLYVGRFSRHVCRGIALQTRLDANGKNMFRHGITDTKYRFIRSRYYIVIARNEIILISYLENYTSFLPESSVVVSMKCLHHRETCDKRIKLIIEDVSFFFLLFLFLFFLLYIYIYLIF